MVVQAALREAAGGPRGAKHKQREQSACQSDATCSGLVEVSG